MIPVDAQCRINGSALSQKKLKCAVTAVPGIKADCN